MRNGNKYSLLWLLNYYRLTMITLARESGVSISLIQGMAAGAAVSKEAAEQVLAVLSRVAGIRFTVNEVEVTIAFEPDRRTTIEATGWTAFQPQEAIGWTWTVPQPQPTIGWTPKQPPPAQIAVIDDSPTVRKIFETCLTREGYTVRCFANGIEALKSYDKGEQAPKLIFIDVEMPGPDGFEVARALMARPAFSGTAIIFISRFGGAVNKLKGRLCGARLYLTKPVSTQILLLAAQQFIPPYADDKKAHGQGE